MKTIIGEAFAYLEKKKIASFDEIWNEVSSQMSDQWKEQFTHKSEKKVKETKMAELYTLLTITGKFIRTSDSKFGLVKNFTFEEVQSMKVNIGEMKE